MGEKQMTGYDVVNNLVEELQRFKELREAEYSEEKAKALAAEMERDISLSDDYADSFNAVTSEIEINGGLSSGDELVTAIRLTAHDALLNLKTQGENAKESDVGYIIEDIEIEADAYNEYHDSVKALLEDVEVEVPKQEAERTLFNVAYVLASDLQKVNALYFASRNGETVSKDDITEIRRSIDDNRKLIEDRSIESIREASRTNTEISGNVNEFVEQLSHVACITSVELFRVQYDRNELTELPTNIVESINKTIDCINHDMGNIYEALDKFPAEAEKVEYPHGTTYEKRERTGSELYSKYLGEIGVEVHKYGTLSFQEVASGYMTDIGLGGYDFFDGFEEDAEISISTFDDVGYDEDAHKEVREAFEDDLKGILEKMEERYEIMVNINQVGRNERHKPVYEAEIVPLFNDKETGKVLSIYDVASKIDQQLKGTYEAETEVSRTFYRDSGWEARTKNIEYDVEYDIDELMTACYDHFKKTVDREIAVAEVEAFGAPAYDNKGQPIKKTGTTFDGEQGDDAYREKFFERNIGKEIEKEEKSKQNEAKERKRSRGDYER